MFVAFQEFKLPPNSGEQINDKWGDGPVRWIMTSNEKTSWASLAGGPEWQEFVDKFWESRNPQPGNPDNVFKTGFDRRVAFADANWPMAMMFTGNAIGCAAILLIGTLKRARRRNR